MIDKNTARLRRAKQTRSRIREQRVARLTVIRSSQHIYAQVYSADGSKVVASASTVEKEMRASSPNGSNKAAAAIVGTRVAERAKLAGIEAVAFDRAGLKFHGRIQALAEAAREAGLKF